MFATVLTRLDHQDASARAHRESVNASLESHRQMLERIETAMANRINNVEEDVESLSVWRTEINAKIVVVSLIVSGVGTVIGSIAVAFVTKFFK